MKEKAQKILDFLGWTIDGSFPKLDRYVVVVAPHRSWKDFVIGLLVKWVSPLPPLRFVFKHEYTKIPIFHQFLLSLGGIAVDRWHKRGGLPKGTVTEILVKAVSGTEPGIAALAPEGTRDRGVEWRTGFYQIVLRTKVPVIMIGLDYAHKKVLISKPLHISGIKEFDLEKIRNWYQAAVPGYVPNLNEKKF
jgi:1-acyl-sn-glycerol-3-phosphate acyltransferase